MRIFGLGPIGVSANHSAGQVCYKFAAPSTIEIVGGETSVVRALPRRDELYRTAIEDFGRALDRLGAGYEADPEKRLDLRQEIHLQLWKSLEVFDERCSLKTWTFRVAHNTAVSYVIREQRANARLISLEEIELTPLSYDWEPNIDRDRLLQQLLRIVQTLKPLDRQIMICHLEEMDALSISGITGLSVSNVAMKIHRIKNLISRRFLEEHHHA